jgi:hypothetical protein
MFPIYEHNFGFTIEAIFLVVGVVDEASFVTKASGINAPFTVEVEKEGHILSVVNDSSTIGFVERNNLLSSASTLETDLVRE